MIRILHFFIVSLLVGLAGSGRAAGWTPLVLSDHAGKSMFDTLRATWTLPRGAQVIDGVPWNIDGIIELRGYDHTARTNVDGIRIGVAFERIHLLNACSGRATNEETIAELSLNYADGTNARLPIRYGHQVLPFTASRYGGESPPLEVSTHLVWRGETSLSAAANDGMRLYHCTLTNPFPEKVVVAMDISSAGSNGGWMLAAATVGMADSPKRKDTYTVPARLEPRPGSRSGKPATLTGEVCDLSGNPIAGTRILLGGLRPFDGWRRETSIGKPASMEKPITDSLGRFSFQLTTDQYAYELIAIADGYEPGVYHGADPLRSPVEIRLRKTSVPPDTDTVVRGRLLDEHGDAIIGAGISAL